VLSLQEQFLAPEFRQLVENCRTMDSSCNTLPDIKLVPGILSLVLFIRLYNSVATCKVMLSHNLCALNCYLLFGTLMPCLKTEKSLS